MITKESPAGCYLNKTGNAWALYDPEIDEMSYYSTQDDYIKISNYTLMHRNNGWNLIGGFSPLPPISYCSECDEPMWIIDYLCGACRGNK